MGRLSVEKNVALLATVHQELERMGIHDFRFMIVGHGAEEAWLRERLPRAEFTGVLKGKALSQAYANMDLFVFPSHTDTFGNVVLEALASGVPAIVTGPMAAHPPSFATAKLAASLPTKSLPMLSPASLRDPAMHAVMGKAARAYALTMSWDAVFDGVYAAYDRILSAPVSSR